MVVQVLVLVLVQVLVLELVLALTLKLAASANGGILLPRVAPYSERRKLAASAQRTDVYNVQHGILLPRVAQIAALPARETRLPVR